MAFRNDDDSQREECPPHFPENPLFHWKTRSVFSIGLIYEDKWTLENIHAMQFIMHARDRWRDNQVEEKDDVINRNWNAFARSEPDAALFPLFCGQNHTPKPASQLIIAKWARKISRF